jgi:hypothetical protein
MPRLYNEDHLPLPVQAESLEGSLRHSLQAVNQLRAAVAEDGDSSRTQKKWNVCRRKPLPSSAVKTVTQNTSLCVTVICKV